MLVWYSSMQKALLIFKMIKANIVIERNRRLDRIKK